MINKETNDQIKECPVFGGEKKVCVTAHIIYDQDNNPFYVHCTNNCLEAKPSAYCVECYYNL